jgi:hypothetical protein
MNRAEAVRSAGCCLLLTAICFAGFHGIAAGQNQTKTTDNGTRQAGGNVNANGSNSGGRNVSFNRLRLSQQELTTLERQYRIAIQDGAYWYDKMSGAWGIEGGPTLGIGIAGVNLGGPLLADASNGTTKVFINGRELHYIDVLGLSQLGPVIPGRYWVDAWGNVGYEGGPALFNLVLIAKAKGSSSRCSPIASGRSFGFNCAGSGDKYISVTDPTGKTNDWWPGK